MVTENGVDPDTLQEYHFIFSDEGALKVTVKFAGSNSQIPDKRMDPHQLNLLIEPSTGEFVRAMRFDDHPFELIRVDISLLRKTVTLHVRPPEIRWN